MPIVCNAILIETKNNFNSWQIKYNIDSKIIQVSRNSTAPIKKMVIINQMKNRQGEAGEAITLLNNNVSKLSWFPRL